MSIPSKLRVRLGFIQTPAAFLRFFLGLRMNTLYCQLSFYLLLPLSLLWFLSISCCFLSSFLCSFLCCIFSALCPAFSPSFVPSNLPFSSLPAFVPSLHPVLVPPPPHPSFVHSFLCPLFLLYIQLFFRYFLLLPHIPYLLFRSSVRSLLPFFHFILL